MKIDSVILHRLRMELVSPFVTSYGAYADRETIIVQAIDSDGHVGWGECVAITTPWYTEETVQGAWHMLQQFIIPPLLQQEIKHPHELTQLLSGIKRNAMAKAAVEMAVWDAYAKRQNKPLDRKSTRLNSSHVKISYAVFC